MSIELPKDAEGREIPLDTKVLYDRYGFKQNVKLFAYIANTDTWRVKFMVGTSLFAVSDMHLAEPDSWEKLEEDLDRCISGDSACRYFVASENCEDCRIDKNNEQGGCVELVVKDIKERIRKLRGVAE